MNSQSTLTNEQDNQRHRRSGGRHARHTLRNTHVPDRVIRPGLVGGRYQPLTEEELKKIYAAALEVLEQIGMGNPSPELLDIALRKGATLDENGRLLFPRALMEDIIDKAPKSFIHYAPNPKFDLEIGGGNRVHFRTNGTAPGVFDYTTRSARRSTLQDIYDFTRLIDQLDNIHSCTPTILATEYSEDTYLHDMNVLYALLSACQKPLAMDTCTAGNIDHFIKMIDLFLGEEGAFLKRPFVLFMGCPVVSPLRFGTENLEVVMRCAQLGLAYDIAVAPQAGATSPAALAGSLVQVFAETLATLAVVQMVNPAAPFMMGHWPFISDLRTGSFTGGSGEQALISAAVTQLCNYANLPSSVSACMTDAKIPDNQAGYEKGITATLVAHAGCNYISEAFGMLGSLMACSYESMIIDNDMVGSILRTVRGIEVNEDTLSLDVIRQTVFGSGHFLNSEQTLSLMETEYLYPSVADRQSYGLWEQLGKKDIHEIAHERAKKMLKDYYPQYINPKADALIRQHFPIMLTPDEMRPGNGRW